MDLTAIADHDIDLGPKSSGQLFQIPENTWTEINKRAFFVVAPGPFGYTHYSRLLFYTDLKTQCENWRDQIFPQIKTYFESYTALSNQVVSTWYPQLTTLFAAMQQGALTITQQQEFQAVVQSVQAAVQPLKQASNKMDPMITAFRDMNVKVDQMIGSELGVNPEALETAINTVNDDWNSMDEDLNFLMNEIYPKLSGGSPIIVQVNMEAAITEWQHLADEIKGFGTAMTAQQPFIDGNFPYLLWVEIPDSELASYVQGDANRFRNWNYATMRWAQQKGYAIGISDCEKFTENSDSAGSDLKAIARIGVPSNINLLGPDYLRGALVFSKAFDLVVKDVDVSFLKIMFPGLNFPSTSFWDDSVPPFKVGYVANMWATNQQLIGAVPTWDSGKVQSQTERLYGFKSTSGIIQKDIPVSELAATFPGAQVDLNDERFWLAAVMRWARSRGYAAGIPDWKVNETNNTKGALLFPAELLG